MVIRFTRTGGFIGTTIKCTINVDELTREQQKKWKLLISRSKIEKSEKQLAKGADLYYYCIAIEHGDSKITLIYDSITYPERLQELINYLESNSRVYNPRTEEDVS